MHLYNYRYPNGCKVSTYLSLIVVPNYWVGVSPCPRSQQCNVHNVSKYSTGSLGTETIDPGRIPRILDHTVEELEVIKFDIDTWGKRPLWWLLKVKSEKVVIVAFRKYRCPLRNSMDCGVKKCLAVTS